MAVDIQDKAGDDWEEKSAAPLAAINQTLGMLGDLSERMNRMEVSQIEQADKH